MQRGTIGFTTNRHSQVSAIIRRFTNSPWSHTFVVADQTADQTYVLEANAGGTDLRSWKEYSDPAVCPTQCYEPIADPKDINRAFLAAQKKFEGVTYGYFELLAIAVKIILAQWGLRFHDPVEQGAICSQVVWYYLNQLFPKEFGQLDEYSVTPADLHKLVAYSPLFKRVPYDQNK